VVINQDEQLISGWTNYEPLEMEETLLWVECFDRGTWQVVRIDEQDFLTGRVLGACENTVECRN